MAVRLRHGVSTFISVLFYLAIVVSAIGIVLNVAFPLLDRMQDTGAIQHNLNFLQTLDQHIQAVASGGTGSSRTLTHTFRQGELRFDETTGQLYYTIETTSPLISSQRARRIGPVTVSADADVSVEQVWLNGTACTLLKNQYLEACLRTVPEPLDGAVDTRGYWLMDAHDNATVLDAAAPGNSGVFTGEVFHHGVRGATTAIESGDPGWGVGRYGDGLMFDGVNDFVNVTNDSATDLRSSFTVAAWLKPAEDCGSTRMEVLHAQAQWILRCEDRNETGFGSPGNTFSPGIQLQLQSGGLWYNVNASIPIDDWSYVAGTFNGTHERLYVDGVLRDEYGVAGSVDPGAWSPTIGSHPAGSNYFNGSIDEVRLWDRALTPGEINQSMAGHFPPNRSISSYSFEAGTGQVVHDTHERVQGRFRGATSFDGSNDQISLDASSLPSGNDQYAVSAWFTAEQDCSCGIIGWGNWGTGDEVTALRLRSAGAADEVSLRHYWWGNDLDATTTVAYGGAWHHVVAQFNGSHREIWLDGELVAQDQPTGHDAVATDAHIGVTNSNEYFNGSVDAVRVYNRSLSREQIEYEYLKGADEQYVNTSQLLVQLQNTETDEILDGRLWLQVNGSASSRDGRGAVRGQTGAAAATGRVQANISNSEGRYNVTYSLLSGADFLTVQTTGETVTAGLDYVLTSRDADDVYIDGQQRGEGVYTQGTIDYGAVVSEDADMVAGLVIADGFQSVGFNNQSLGSWYGVNGTTTGSAVVLLPFTRGSFQDVQQREDLIRDGVFGPNLLFGYPRPNFGYQLGREKAVRAALQYDTLLLDGFDRSIGPGIHTIQVTNNGVVNGLVNVSVKVR